MTAMMEAAPLSFDAGRVVGASLGVFRRRWRPIVVLALVVWAIAVTQNLARLAQYQHGSHDLRRFAIYALSALAFLAIGWLRDAAIVGVSLEPPGERRGFVHGVEGAIRVFLPLLPFRLLASGPALVWTGWSAWALAGRTLSIIQIDLAVGAVLWIYGLVLIALFGLATPVALVERSGPIALLRRSAALLSAGRWRFLALAIAMDVVGALPATFGGVIVAFLATRVSRFGMAGDAAAYLRIEGVAIALLSSLVTAFWMTITAVSYREFRRIREGAPHDELASIFA